MYRIGIDLGGTNIAVGIVNDEYHIVRKDSVPTGATRPGAEIVKDMADLCRKVAEDAGIAFSDILSVGVASPGMINAKEGVVKYANNLPFEEFPIARMLSEQLDGKQVFVENDANAAAWGEAIAGAGQGTADSVMVTLGTGVGGGVIIDHKVYSGFNGAGAEPGHTVIAFGGEKCTCGRRGCWEAYSSATALIRMTREKLEECEKAGRKTMMSDLVKERGKVTGRTAFQAFRAGDEAGKEVVDTYMDYLACGVTNMINIFQPEVISIGGGISGEGQLLVDMMTERVRREQYGVGHAENTEIRIARLGNDAGIVGAAVLGME